MQQTTSTAAPQGWHTSNWGFWGWLETGVKLVGIAAGILAFLQSPSDAPLVFSGNPHLAAVILLGLLTLGAVTLQPVFRFIQKEIVSFGFAILQAVGHVGMLIALLRVPSSVTLPLILAIAYIVGELVKQRFLAISGYTEGGQSTGAMMNFSRGLMGVYLVLAVLLLI